MMRSHTRNTNQRNHFQITPERIKRNSQQFRFEINKMRLIILLYEPAFWYNENTNLTVYHLNNILMLDIQFILSFNERTLHYVRSNIAPKNSFDFWNFHKIQLT